MINSPKKAGKGYKKSAAKATAKAAGKPAAKAAAKPTAKAAAKPIAHKAAPKPVAKPTAKAPAAPYIAHQETLFNLCKATCTFSSDNKPYFNWIALKKLEEFLNNTPLNLLDFNLEHAGKTALWWLAVAYAHDKSNLFEHIINQDTYNTLNLDFYVAAGKGQGLSIKGMLGAKLERLLALKQDKNKPSPIQIQPISKVPAAHPVNLPTPSKETHAPSLRFKVKEPVKPTPAEEELEQLSFVLANNNIKVLHPTEAEEVPTTRQALIAKLYRPKDGSYIPQEIGLTNEFVMLFIRDVSNAFVFTPNIIDAIENIAYRISSSAIYILKPTEIFQILKVIARVEPFTIPLLSCFDSGLRILTNQDLKNYTPREVIDLAYYATKIARPITGNIRVSLEKLVPWIMVNTNVNELAKIGLLPRVIKILHFMEKCVENFQVDVTFKNIIVEKIKQILKSAKPESSPPHIAFSHRLKTLLAAKGIKVEDEFPCDLVGTHLDIAIPSCEIAIEINGTTHYNTDLVTENPETKFKRELLEAFGWKVVPVLVDDLVCHELEVLDLRIIDDIILNEIIPLLNANKEKIQSRLVAEANRNFFLCRKPGRTLFEEYRTAKEYIQAFERVQDPEEAKRRIEALKQVTSKPMISSQLKNGTIVELDFDDVDDDKVDSVITSYFAMALLGAAEGITGTDTELTLDLGIVRKNRRPLVQHYFDLFTEDGGHIKTTKPTFVAHSSGPKP